MDPTHVAFYNTRTIDYVEAYGLRSLDRTSPRVSACWHLGVGTPGVGTPVKCLALGRSCQEAVPTAEGREGGLRSPGAGDRDLASIVLALPLLPAPRSPAPQTPQCLALSEVPGTWASERL